MGRIELVDPDESGDPRVQDFSPLQGPDGSINHHFGVEAHFPEVMVNVYEARLALARRGDLGNRMFTKVAVATSMANECAFCVGAYSTQLSRQLGGDEAVRAFQQAVRNGTLDGKEADVIAFARKILDDPHAVTDTDFERLRERHGFSDRTFVELLYMVNIVSGYNRLTITVDAEYDHPYPESWAEAAAAPMDDQET